MVKEVPTFGRILVMAVFALACFALILFTWLAFGGSVPLKPEKWRVRVAIPEAITLATEVEVRIAGVDVGKIKKLELEQGATRTLVEMELDDDFAPIPSDTRAIMRQKTILGETFIELSPGSPLAPKLPENGKLADGQVEQTVQADELIRIFDNPTKRAYATLMRELTRVFEDDRSQDMNDAIGNLPGFAGDGADVLAVLDVQEKALTEWIRQSGVVFDALNRREGELSDMIVNSSRFFSATQARDDELAETIRVFPSFLRQTRLTMDRLATFSKDTQPLVNQLKPVADQLGPTVRDLGALGPDLEATLKSLDPLIDESDETLPEGARLLKGLEPVLESVHTFLPEFNPALAILDFNKTNLSDFISYPGAALAGRAPGTPDDNPGRYLSQFAFVNGRTFQSNGTRESNEIGNAYLAPNALNRRRPFGVIESFDCRPAGGERPKPEEMLAPCFVQPPSLFDGNQYPRLTRGKAPIKPTPYTGNEGTQPADP